MKYKLTLITLLFLMIPSSVGAIVQGYGGRITMPIYCTCSGGVMSYVYDFKTSMPLPIVHQYGYSRLNSQYNLFTPGNSVLGTYTPGGICIVYVGASCVPMPVIGMVTPYPMSGVGTSLTP